MEPECPQPNIWTANRGPDEAPRHHFRFFHLLPKFHRVYTCLDGLDECEDLTALMDVPRKRLSSSCQIFITSRKTPLLSRILGHHLEIRMEDHNMQDIEQSIRHFPCQYPELDGIMDPMVAGRLSQALRFRSNRRWAAIFCQ